MARKMTAKDEGDIVGWATTEEGQHYPIHAAQGGGGASSSHAEKMRGRAAEYREMAGKARKEAEAAWNRQGEMARETPMGQPVIASSYGNYRKSMQSQFEKSRQAAKKAEELERKAANIEKRYAKVDAVKVRQEITMREGWKTSLSKAEKAIKAGNREEAISAMAETNPKLRPLLEKQSLGTLKQMISGTKKTNAQELKKLKAQGEKSRNGG